MTRAITCRSGKNHWAFSLCTLLKPEGEGCVYKYTVGERNLTVSGNLLIFECGWRGCKAAESQRQKQGSDSIRSSDSHVEDIHLGISLFHLNAEESIIQYSFPSIYLLLAWSKNTVVRFLSPGSAKHYVHMFVTSNGLLLIPILQMRKNWGLRNKAFYPRQALDFTWIQVVQVPGVSGRRHGWQGERGGPAVGFHQPTLDGTWAEALVCLRAALRGAICWNWTWRGSQWIPGVVLVDLLVDLPVSKRERERK